MPAENVGFGQLIGHALLAGIDELMLGSDSRDLGQVARVERIAKDDALPAASGRWRWFRF
jgi:hypothetical protein